MALGVAKGLRAINQLIKINDHKMEVLLKGNKGPLVIILTGMGCSFEEWYKVTQTLSKTYRVLTFHRQGLGQSEIGSGIQNTASTVRDLAEILHHLQIDEPFYLMGHSYGGLCVQHFAKVHPEMVAGVILVDSTSVDLKELEKLDLPVLNQDTDEMWIEKSLEYSTRSEQELLEILKPSINEKHCQFPKTIQQKLLDFQVNPLLFKAMASEIKEWTKDAEVIRSLGDFPDVPLIVIGRDKEYSIQSELDNGIPEWELRVFEEKWEELITHQSKLSLQGELVFASDSGHSVFLDRPDLIIECVHKMVRRVDCVPSLQK
ncbi:alpha/beta hydrolase [Rossellomorea sp. KS-H15a]|uniref:alpha/beta hydrolase n=1 Tax=Rossellomorea sp. KS-H15a TaxID=2963940 RepID=UPI0020C5CDAC|nr:alpha/beta hydrolase [Rossellomorea sp. KS-H15a]UTE76730.1 alpha/beta hydrolase [Rossellomorea sp. KS-H15a]